MTTIDDEESYFKLKKTNEELTVLVNKVINDFKQTKSQLVSEKDKNSVISQRNVSLENQVIELSSKYESQLQDPRDEVTSIKTHTETVEGVAGNFCVRNMEQESKYEKLKRQSTLMFSLFALDANIEFDLDFCDSGTPLSPISPLTHSTPTISVPDVSEITKPYEENLSKEMETIKNLQLNKEKLMAEIETLKEKIVNLKLKLEEKNPDIEKIENDQILNEQKGDFGFAAMPTHAPPPPHLAPPPPPPPPNLIKIKHTGNNGATTKINENFVLELQSTLQQMETRRVLRRHSSLDFPDSSTKEPPIKLRSTSVSYFTNTPINEQSELSRAFKKRNITPYDEQSKE